MACQPEPAHGLSAPDSPWGCPTRRASQAFGCGGKGQHTAGAPVSEPLTANGAVWSGADTGPVAMIRPRSGSLRPYRFSPVEGDAITPGLEECDHRKVIRC